MHSLWRVFDKKGMTEMSKLSIPVGISNFEKSVMVDFTTLTKQV